MYTLVSLNGNLNRPDTLPSFLQSNVGKNLMLQIDCVAPFQGTADELAEKVCGHLNAIDLQIEVNLQEIKNASAEMAKFKQQVSFMVMQIQITNK